MTWIKCSERMPGDYENVLMVCHQRVLSGVFHPQLGESGKGDFGLIKKGKRTTSIERIEHISHWMPLPEPPKGV